jgi:hypothetical protein
LKLQAAFYWLHTILGVNAAATNEQTESILNNSKGPRERGFEAEILLYDLQKPRTLPGESRIFDEVQTSSKTPAPDQDFFRHPLRVSATSFL